MENAQKLSETLFRKEEKKFKRQTGKRKDPNQIPSLEDIIDMQNDVSKLIPFGNNIYGFGEIPGLILLPKYFSDEQQKYWIDKSLNEYSVSSSYPNNIVNVDPSQTTSQYSRNLSWSRLGASYSWSKGEYNDDEMKSNFPPDLSVEVKKIVNEIDKVDKLRENVIYENFNPEVAFIKYYLVGSTMMAHQDKSEQTFDRPLISISLGSSAIFLIGTENRNDKPHAFLLRSGDVIAMTGKSRLAYHGVPRILNDCPEHLVEHNENMKGLRININVRQVFIN